MKAQGELGAQLPPETLPIWRNDYLQVRDGQALSPAAELLIREPALFIFDFLSRQGLRGPRHALPVSLQRVPKGVFTQKSTVRNLGLAST